MRKSNLFSDTVENAQADLEKLVGDVRNVLSSKDLDGVPEIRALRARLEDSAGNARDINFDPTGLPVGDRAVARSGAGRARGGVFGVVQPPPA